MFILYAVTCISIKEFKSKPNSLQYANSGNKSIFPIALEENQYLSLNVGTLKFLLNLYRNRILSNLFSNATVDKIGDLKVLCHSCLKTVFDLNPLI